MHVNSNSCTERNTSKQKDWQTDWLTDWLIDWTEWLIDWLTDISTWKKELTKVMKSLVSYTHFFFLFYFHSLFYYHLIIPLHQQIIRGSWTYFYSVLTPRYEMSSQSESFHKHFLAARTFYWRVSTRLSPFKSEGIASIEISGILF